MSKDSPIVLRVLTQCLTRATICNRTVHHVHADDVAQVVERVINNRSVGIGEAFHAVSSGAITLRGYAEAMHRWLGHQPKLAFEPYELWSKSQDLEDAAATLEHILRSPNCSIEKGRRLLEYAPCYSSIEAVREAVIRLIENRDVRGSNLSISHRATL